MTENEELSTQQMNVLRAIWEHRQDHQRSPTYRELKTAIGAGSLAVPSHHVRSLEDMGYLQRDEHVARGLTLTERALIALRKSGLPAVTGVDIVQIPLKGTIAAGEPVDPGEESGDESDTLAVDGRLLPKRRDNLFALRVRGDSMIDALVQEGDIVLMQQVSEVKNGDMVAAWLQLEEETTLKHFFLEGQTARLQPANPLYEPIIVPADNVQIQGKVVMVLRQPSAA